MSFSYESPFQVERQTCIPYGVADVFEEAGTSNHVFGVASPPKEGRRRKRCRSSTTDGVDFQRDCHGAYEEQARAQQQTEGTESTNKA